MLSRRFVRFFVVVGLLAGLLPAAPGVALAAGTVDVTPASMGTWILTESSTANAAIVAGPGSPPIGTGSVELAVGADGNSAAQARSTAYNGTLLADVDALEYATYVVQDGSGGQAPYLLLNVDLDGNGSTDDQLFFEPVYQTGAYAGDPVPNQGALTVGAWQEWDALAGGWWSLNAATFGPPLVSFANYVAANPGARLATSATGAFRIVTGFGAGSWDNFIGNADAVIVGVSGDTTTYNFDPTPQCTSTCYVGPGGSDANGGTSPADAKLTIQAAINTVNPGGQVIVAAGTYNEDVLVNKDITLTGAGAGSTTIRGPIGGSGSTIQVTASGVTIDGFTVTRAGNNTTDWNNPNLNFAGLAIQGQAVTNAEIRNNRFEGNRTGIDLNNSNGHSIHNNEIDDNRTGLILRNQTDNLTVVENDISNNWTVGVLFLDASGGTNSPVQTAANSIFSNNNISGNWYGEVVDRQTGGALPAPGTTNLKNFSGNWYGTSSPSRTIANSTEPGYAAQIPVAYGGTATPPPSAPDLAGPASANIDYTPFLWTGTDTDVETTPGRGTFGFQGDFSELGVTADGAQTGAVNRIQEGVNLAVGSTVHVLSGDYVGDVSIATDGLELLGAQAGIAVGPRTFGAASESELSGTITIHAADVTIDGFSITKSIATGSAFGVVVNNAGDGATITRNIFDTITTAGVGGINSAQAVFLQSGPDDVSITGNRIDGVTSDRSAKGIFIGDSASPDASENVVISGNEILDVNSARGAYGVLVNSATGAPNLLISANTIDDLSGAWAHGVGLEGNTPNANVHHNTVSNLSATSPDRIGVFFQNNPSVSTVLVNRNLLDVGPTSAGIALHSDLVAAMPSALVNGECNWWGSASGPGPVGPGTGSLVGTNVDFTPWLTTSDLNGACFGGEARDTKNAVLDDLEAIAGTGDKDHNKGVEKAIEAIEKSLESDRWIDDNHLARKHGNKVFDDEKKAVKELQGIKNPGANAAVIQDSIDALVDADRLLAETARDEATPAQAAKADAEIAKGDAEAATDPDKAIDHYKKAWEHATK